MLDKEPLKYNQLTELEQQDCLRSPLLKLKREKMKLIPINKSVLKYILLIKTCKVLTSSGP